MSLLPLELSLKPMRPYQSRSYSETRGALATHRCIVLQLPTGAGKTVIALHIIVSCLSLGKKPLFIVPMVSLIDKTIRAFEEQGLTDIGVIQRQHARTDPQARLQIASMQTLIRRPELMQGFDLVIVDEAHEQYADFYDWMRRDVKTRFIGLTATPWAKGMGRHWSGLVIGATMPELLANGAICPFEVYEPKHLPDRRRVKVDGSDFQEAAAAKAMGEKQLVADVYEMWQERGSKARWFVLAQNCKHAQVLMADFQSHGVSCGYIDADTPLEERDGPPSAILPRFRAMDIHVLFSVGCLGTGIDEDVRGISLAYLTKSRMKLTQDMGRAGRTAQGKTHADINDHGGNIHALGMPEDYDFDHLDKSDPNSPGDAYAEVREPAKPKKCASCRMVLPPKTKACPKCGVEIVVTTDVVTVDGELVKRVKSPPKEKYSMAQKQEFFSGFLGIATDKGYKPGWAANKYREMVGVWPKGLIDLPSMPTRKVLDFEKHSRIKWAKSKEAASRQQVSA